MFTLYADLMTGRVAEYLSGSVDGVMYPISQALSKAKSDLGEKDIYGVSFACGQADADRPFYLIDYPSIYAEVLKKEKKYKRFELIYVDEDAIPELACFDGFGAMLNKVTLYTLYNGEPTLLGEFGSYGWMGYSERKNRIYSGSLRTANQLGDSYMSDNTFMINEGKTVKGSYNKNERAEARSTGGFSNGYTNDAFNREELIKGNLQ